MKQFNTEQSLAEKCTIGKVSIPKEIKGQTFTYSKLCEALNLPKKVGNAKQSQLKQLSLQCELAQEKIGGNTYYTITEVYDSENILETMKKDSRYFYFVLALYDSLFPKMREQDRFDEEGYLTISPSELMIELGYLNDKFFEDVREHYHEGNLDYYDFCEQAYDYCKNMMYKDLETVYKKYGVIRDHGFFLYKKVSYYDMKTGVTKTYLANKTPVTVHSKLWKDIYGIFDLVLPHYWIRSSYDYGLYMDEINKRIFELTGGEFDVCKEAIAIMPVRENFNESVSNYIKALKDKGLYDKPLYQIILKTVASLRRSESKVFKEWVYNDIYRLYFADDYLLRDNMEKFTTSKESRVYPKV